MEHFREIVRFARPYIGRYWLRFVAGILLGVLFGMSNGLFVGSVYTVVPRLSNPGAISWRGVGSALPTTSRLTRFEKSVPSRWNTSRISGAGWNFRRHGGTTGHGAPDRRRRLEGLVPGPVAGIFFSLLQSYHGGANQVFNLQF